MFDNQKKNMIMMVLISCTVLLNGCKEPEVVFTDVHDVTDSESVESVIGDPVIPIGEEADTVEEEPITIMVHVCGAVTDPGVYELDENSRVMDAVNRANGFLDTAADDSVNLAAPLTDGMMIRIPTEEEAALLATEGSISDAGLVQMAGEDGAASQKVNINTADKILLCTLPGIGETRAGAIIDYRESNGMFSAVEDIMNVSGIKESSFQKIKEYITVK